MYAELKVNKDTLSLQCNVKNRLATSGYLLIVLSMP